MPLVSTATPPGTLNRDYLARHEGFSMVVLDSEDAAADLAAWNKAGLKTYEPFEFSRMAKRANGEEIRVGFALAFVSNPAAPWLGLFSCRHFAPAYFEQTEYLAHANSAIRVEDVWITGDGAMELAGYLGKVTGVEPVADRNRIVLATRIGTIVLAPPAMFAAAFGATPPHPQSGPHLAGYTIGCRSLDFFADKPMTRVGDKLILSPQDAFGTALAFQA